jgi:hypothetical protein
MGLISGSHAAVAWFGSFLQTQLLVRVFSLEIILAPPAKQQ